MKWLSEKIQAEPNALSELVRQFLYMLLGFELIRWTDPQMALVLSFVSGLLAFLARRAVTPNVTLEQAGHSVLDIKAQAATNVAATANAATAATAAADAAAADAKHTGGGQ